MKILTITLLLLMVCVPAYAADQWDKTDPAGTELISDIDTLIQANNEALDRLVLGYRKNCTVIADTVAQVKVVAGEIAIPNAAESIVRWRRTTSTTTVTWADLDTGSEANSTQYYLYVLAETDATTFTVQISASSANPSGATFYRKIGSFYNDASGNITWVHNSDGEAGSAVIVVGTSDITTSSATYVDMTDMDIDFISSGRPILVHFDAPMQGVDTFDYFFTLDIAGTDQVEHEYYAGGGNGHAVQFPASISYLYQPAAAGKIDIKVQWKVEGNTLYQNGAIDAANANTTHSGARILWAMEV